MTEFEDSVSVMGCFVELNCFSSRSTYHVPVPLGNAINVILLEIPKHMIPTAVPSSQSPRCTPWNIVSLSAPVEAMVENYICTEHQLKGYVLYGPEKNTYTLRARFSISR